MKILDSIFKLSCALVICFLAFFFRTPFLANLRSWVLWVIVIVSFGLIISEVVRLTQKVSFSKKISNLLILIVTSFGLFTALSFEFNFILAKQNVLNQDNN